MKNQYYLLLIVSLLMGFSIQAQILEEGFESWPPSDWTLDPGSGTGEWVQSNCDIPTTGGNAGPGMALEGEFAAMFNNYDYNPGVIGAMTTPAFDLSSLETPIVHFYWWNNDAPLDPALLVVQSSSDGVTFNSLDTIITIGSGETNWIEYYHLLTADITHIKITGISDYGLKNTFIDAFSIIEAPSCLQPSNLIVSNIQSTSVQIDWTIGNDETAWIVEYGLEGFELGEGANISTETHPITIDGLSINTNYELYVKSDCDDEDSPWAGPLAFTTLCETIVDFPWEEGFENGNFGCFTLDQSNPAETWFWSNDVSPVGPYAGEGFARIAYSLSPQDEWLISPVLDLSNIGIPSLHFYWVLSYAVAVDPNDNYDLIVQASTDGMNWTPIWDESMEGVFESWVYQEQLIDLSMYAGEENFQFAFNYVGTDGAAAYIDEVTIDFETSISRVNNEKKAQIYPNPSSNMINILSEESIEKIVLYNMMGRSIKEFYPNNTNTYRLLLQDLSKGQYFISIQTNNTIDTQMIQLIK